MSNNHEPPLSAEAKNWLDRRERAHQLRQSIAASGGHVMLRTRDIDPLELGEPLRSEVIGFLRRTGKWSGDDN